jgi:hypothetical protein
MMNLSMALSRLEAADGAPDLKTKKTFNKKIQGRSYLLI